MSAQETLRFARDDDLVVHGIFPQHMSKISWTQPHSASEPGRQTDTDVQKDVDKDEMLWVEPPYRVLIHNDDVTTFEFVIDMLQKIFKLSYPQAEQVAVMTHISGIALVCVRPQGEAERLVNQGIFAARLEGFPLMLSCEPE